MNWLEKPTLTGRLVQLRPFAERDLEAMGEALSDPEVLRLTGSVHSEIEARAKPPQLDETALAWYRSRNEAPDRLDLAIIERATDRCVGEAVLNQFDEANPSCNFRILIGPAGRDRGLGTEATRLMVAHGFTTLGLHRISLEVYAFNPRARHAYEKAGFRAEGVAREALCFDGEWIDAIQMAVLETDLMSRPGRGDLEANTLSRDLRPSCRECGLI